MTRIQTTEITYRGQRMQCVAGQLSVKAAAPLAKNPAAAEAALREALGPAASFRFLFPFDEQGVAAIELTDRADLAATAAQIERHPGIQRAAPITVTRISPMHKVTHRPGDPLYRQQWGAQKIRMPEAWGYALQANILLNSNQICVAVLDTGLPFAGNPPLPSHEDMDHPKRFFPGVNMITPGAPPDDDNQHGTHVTGIIASEQGKVRGIVGVNWRCNVFVGKVFDADGFGSTMLLYEAVKAAIAFARPRGWRLVINYSGGGPYDPVHEDIGDAVTQAGALLVAAAGNASGPVDYPAALSTRADGTGWYHNVCAVSATDQNDALASFSNFGPQINVAAPGVDIVSALPYAAGATPAYGELSGTSMAAPHVSGIASLVWAKMPTLAAGHVREQIEGTALHLGAPGRNPQFGYGRVDAFRAISEL